MKLTSSTAYSAFIVLAIAGAIAIAGLISVRPRGHETTAAADASIVRPEETQTQPLCAASVAPSGDNRIASYNGVSFTYPGSLASEAEPKLEPASFLVDETDKPEGVVPEHIAFAFKGSYGSRHKSSFFTPEISIYNIQQYTQALAISSNYVRALESDIESLKTMLDTHPTSIEQQVPFLPFGTDATQAFVSHVRYVDFRNGRGLLFLTQFNIEPSLVNNEGLTYVFQGLTNDGLYYVSARFPVALSFLPPGYQTRNFGASSISKFYGSNQKVNQENYKSYVETMKRKLVDVPADRFQPSLTSLDNIVTSLCVMPNK